MNVIVIAMCAAVLSPVELRSGDVIDAPIDAMGPGGVTLGGIQTRVLAWDRIARVTGTDEAEARAYQGLAVDAWRARSRLARGDVRLATPLFERLYAESGALEGPTGLLIAEGAMRCRLDTDPRGSAEAWLEALALRARGVKIDGEPVAAGFTDQVTGLVPTLPPMFLEGSARDAPAIGTGDVRVDAYGALYAFAMGAPMTGLVRASSADPAVEFVRLLVLAQRGEGPERDAARQVLEGQRSSGTGDWRDAWRLGAIGRSLALSENQEERVRAVFTLLEIPARWGASQPHLSAVALHDAAVTLRGLGRDDEAALVHDELVRMFPNHPASRPGAETSRPRPDTTPETNQEPS